MKLASFLDQAEEAFNKAPDLSMVVHGVRKIHQGARGRRTALFPSKKNGMTVAVESQLEADYCLVLERSIAVKSYRCQAIRIDHSAGTYVPDFLIRTTADSWEVHETKPDSIHLDASIQRMFADVRNQLEHIGVNFRVVDQIDVPTKELRENLYLLNRDSYRLKLSPLTLRLAQDAIQTAVLPFGETKKQLSRIGLPPEVAAHMVFHGYWHVDLSQTLHTQTLVMVR